MQTICCLCHKTKHRNGWVKKLVPHSRKLSHGYCPRCFRKILKQIERRGDYGG